MRIHEVSQLPFSREQVFTTYRDHLVELVDYFDNVEKIEVVSREEREGGSVSFENHWYADAPIPKIAQMIIKPEMLKWIDKARWDASTYLCEWEIETFFLKKAIQCSGVNSFKATGDDSMQLTIEGELKINIDGVVGIPSLLKRTVVPKIEQFIVKLISPNFQQVNRGIQLFLEKSE